MKHFVLTYQSVPDIMDRRGPFREEHIALLKKLQSKGHLLLAGAFVGDPPGAVFIFQGQDDSAAKSFAQADPYVVAGLVEKWTVRQWTTVVGEGATNPIS